MAEWVKPLGLRLMAALIGVGLIAALGRFVMAVFSDSLQWHHATAFKRPSVEACRVKIPLDLSKRIGGNPNSRLLFSCS